MTQPSKLLDAYYRHVKTYLQLFHNLSEEQCHEVLHTIQQQYTQQLHTPKVFMVRHKTPGNNEYIEAPLIALTNAMADKIVLPFGSIYKKDTEDVSFLKTYLTELKARRSKSKKLMLKYKQEGKPELARKYDIDQSLQKIAMNSIAGAMGSEYNFMCDKAGFNSITSTGRYYIMNAYTHCERLLEGNFYFPSEDSITNHIVVLAQNLPDTAIIQEAVHQLQLYVPNDEDIYMFLNDHYRIYTFTDLPKKEWMEKLQLLPQDLKTYLFYYCNLKHIWRHPKNSNTAIATIRSLFIDPGSIPTDIITDTSLDILNTVDPDLLIIVTTCYNDLFPTVDGEKYSLHKTVTNEPYIAKQLAYITQHIQSGIEKLSQYLYVFIQPNHSMMDILNCKNIIRETVIVSDTDSIIFSTKNWLQWYTGMNNITTDSYQINTLVVYYLTKTNAQLLERITLERGATPENKSGIQMKNEYFYPVMGLSVVKKHYAGMIMVQEGKVLPKLEPDIKGGQFRGSKLSDAMLKYIRDFINGINTRIIKEGTISVRQILHEYLQFETDLIQYLQEGHTHVLPIVPIRPMEEYKTPGSSIYFNYLLWEEVFAPKYGNISVPSKSYVVGLKPITPTYLEWLDSTDRSIKNRLVKFTEQYPKKDITRIPINPILEQVPDELKPLMDVRSLIWNNVAPIYLYFKTLNIWTGGTKNKPFLISEIYGGVTL